MTGVQTCALPIYWLFIRNAAEAIATGANPLDHWVPQIELGVPQFLFYQHLAPLTVVGLERLTIGAISLFDWFNLVRWTLMVAFPLPVFWSMRRMGFSPIAAAISASVASLLSADGLYGFEFDSYVWRGWGLFTQLFAMHLSFVVLALAYRAVRTGRGLALAALNRHQEAVASFAQAIVLKPDDADAHFDTAMSLLTLGDYPRGFAEYEWRWKRAGMNAKPRFRQPLWLGETPLGSKTILLHAEQGLGDTIQFVRLVPEVAARGARVVLEVQPALRNLVGAIEGVKLLVSRGDPLPVCDFHCPLMSLPLALGMTTVASIPGRTPYLHAPEVLARKASQILRRRPGDVLVGLVWKGNIQNRGDRVRSIPLDKLVRRLALPGVQIGRAHD